MRSLILFLLTSLSYSLPTHAEPAAPAPAAAPEATLTAREQQLVDKAADDAVKKTAAREFAGLSFGVGVSVTYDVGTTERVDSASIVDGIVRIDADKDRVARVMLESHYFIPTTKKRLGLDAGQIGWGPFMAIQPGEDEIINAIGVGVMFGFRREANSDNSWNMGVGYVVDPKVKVLGDGFMANEPPPGSETTVRLKETSQEGWFLLFSFSF